VFEKMPQEEIQKYKRKDKWLLLGIRWPEIPWFIQVNWYYYVSENEARMGQECSWNEKRVEAQRTLAR
jgi:hypothetical protein